MFAEMGLDFELGTFDVCVAGVLVTGDVLS